jgi:ankyrin repeat protein
MGASLSRRGASPDEGAPEAPEAPEAKRPRAASKEEVHFTKVLEDGHNVTAILAFAGYRNVLTLEALCPRARRLIRGARVELDVSNETNLVVAVRAAARAELFEARRARASGAKTHYKFIWDDCRTRASDVVYRDDRALLLSPRARAPALVEGFRGADVDAARSACAVAAKDRRRAALLAIGYFEVELGSRDATGVAERESLRESLVHLLKRKEAEPEAAAPEDAARLIDAMGGAVVTPRRLQLAAGRRQVSLQGEINGTPTHLHRAIRQAASAVLDEASMRRLVVFFWKSMSRHGWCSLNKEQFLEEVCGAAAIGAAEAHAVWQEALSGILLPLDACFAPGGGGFLRDDGDVVRVDDVARVSCFPFLWAAVSAFAIVSLAREPAVCFSPSHYIAGTSFEELVVRSESSNNGYAFSMALAVLDELGAQRDGETSSEAGKQRVAEAVRSLLSEERVHALAAGDEVEYAEGDPDPPQLSPLEWARGRIVSMKGSEKAVIRVGEEEKEAFLGQLRLVEQRPCAAVVLLALALADRRNDIALQILQSPLMKEPLSYVVGEPGKAVSSRTDARCTALDHAIVSKNTVGIGLLFRSVNVDPLDNSWRGTQAWAAVRGTSHCLGTVKSRSALISPAELADLACALRDGPGALNQKYNPWNFMAHWVVDDEVLEAEGIYAAVGGDAIGVRKALAKYGGAKLKARLVSRPWNSLSKLWRSAAPDATDPLDEATHDYDENREVLLIFACKMGRENVVSEVLGHSGTAVHIGRAVAIAVAEGHNRCLELLLTPPHLDKFLSAPNLVAYYKSIATCIDVGNAGAIDLLISSGVSFHHTTFSFSPIELACRAGQADCVRAMLRDPAVVANIRERQSDALLLAARFGRASTLAVLLEKFSLSHQNSNTEFSDTILQNAVGSTDLATVELVLQQPDVDVDMAQPGRMTPLMVACRDLKYNIAAALLARGARVRECRATHFDELDYVLHRSRDDILAAKDILRLLLQEQPILISNFLGYMLGHFIDFNVDIIDIFLKFGANASQADSAGVTLLHACAYYATYFTAEFTEEKRYLQCAEFLILHGADVSAKTTADATNGALEMYDHYPLDAGMTPLDAAAKCGHPDRREAVTQAFEAAILKRDAAAGRTPRVETGS